MGRLRHGDHSPVATRDTTQSPHRAMPTGRALEILLRRPSAAIFLAFWPFLPLGKGALILIFGGALMITVSFVWIGIRPHSRVILEADLEPRPHVSFTSMVLEPRPPRPIKAPAADASWSASFQERAMTIGLPHMEVVTAGPDRCVMIVRHCPSCERLGPHEGGCENERARLERVAHVDIPDAFVTEVTCDLMHSGACVFQVRRGRA